MSTLISPLADLVAWVIIHLHAGLGALFGPNTGLAWGLSIAVLVIIIRLLLVPLFVKQIHAQRKMAEHAPQIAELRKKYKNDKQRLNEETMKYYRENGFNPLASCFPMIPQFIVFFALFYVLRAIAGWTPKVTHPAYGLTVQLMESAQQAKIFGVHLGDKLLFAHPSPPLHVAIVIADRGRERLDDVYDGPAERQARSHAEPGRGPGQPDGPVAEVHDVHRPVLLPDRALLAVRAGAVLGDYEPVDAGPAVLHVQELDAAGTGDGGRDGDHGPDEQRAAAGLRCRQAVRERHEGAVGRCAYRGEQRAGRRDRTAGFGGQRRTGAAIVPQPDHHRVRGGDRAERGRETRAAPARQAEAGTRTRARSSLR